MFSGAASKEQLEMVAFAQRRMERRMAGTSPRRTDQDQHGAAARPVAKAMDGIGRGGGAFLGVAVRLAGREDGPPGSMDAGRLVDWGAGGRRSAREDGRWKRMGAGLELAGGCGTSNWTSPQPRRMEPGDYWLLYSGDYSPMPP